MQLDLLIANGKVFDGSGTEGFIADVGLAGERIAVIGDLAGTDARHTIDASGMVVCPGFIDPHTHCHGNVDNDSMHSDNMIRQGITTVIAGNCGGSGWPIGEHLDKVDHLGFKSNYATLVGHHNVRRIAMSGSGSMYPDYQQMTKMQDLVKQGLEEGAFGITVGYHRPHETFEEIVEVTRPAAEAGTIYSSHIRSEAEGLIQAMGEIIEVAHETGIRVNVSHLKTLGPKNWTKLDMVLKMMEEAVAMGIDIAADRYPYTASHGGSTNIMPQWCHAEARKRGGKEHLKDADLIDRFRKGVEKHLDRLGGPSKLMFTSLKTADPEIDGKTPADLMKLWGCELIDVALEIERRNDTVGAIGTVRFCMSEDNLSRILQHPLVMIGTDGHLEVFGRFATHPRNYGTYPRVLGRFVREEKAISLEKAIMKMTSMPAGRFRIPDRGWLRPGAYADIVVFDPETVIDNATFLSAHQYPTGIPFVIVNGKVAVDNGKTAEEHYGRALRRKS